MTYTVGRFGLARMVDLFAALDTARPLYETEADNDDRLAAAPHSSLAFMFWGEGIFVFPLMLIYTAISYRVFRGKVSEMPVH